MIDFYCGHTWALEYLSDQTKDEILKNENQDEPTKRKQWLEKRAYCGFRGEIE